MAKHVYVAALGIIEVITGAVVVVSDLWNHTSMNSGIGITAFVNGVLLIYAALV